MKSTMLCLVAALTGALVAGAATAQVGEAPTGPLRETGVGPSATMYVLEQAAPRTDTVTTWQWMQFSIAMPSDYGDLDALATRTVINCAARTVRPVGFEAYRDGRLIGATGDDSFEAAIPESYSPEAAALEATCYGPSDLPRAADIAHAQPWTFTAWVPLDNGDLTLFPDGPPQVVMVNEGTISRPKPDHVQAVFLLSNGSVMAPAVVAHRIDCRGRTFRLVGQWALAPGGTLGRRLYSDGVFRDKPFSEARWLGNAAETLCEGDLDPSAPRHASLLDAQIAGGMAEDVRRSLENR